jgi:hypothetical protein
MQNLDKFDTLFVIWAFVFQICLIVLFAIRRSNLDLILQYGWVFYLLSIPAVIVSILILRGGKEWSFWFGGFIFLVWAVFGLIIEYGFRIQWRNPIVWPIFFSLCSAVFGDDHVLLVSAGRHQQTFVVHLCCSFWGEHILEHFFALRIVSI